MQLKLSIRHLKWPYLQLIVITTPLATFLAYPDHKTSGTGICIGMTNYPHSFDEATSSRTFLRNETSMGADSQDFYVLKGFRTSSLWKGVFLVEFRWSVKYFIANINLVYAEKE